MRKIIAALVTCLALAACTIVPAEAARRSGSTSLDGVVAPLAAKAREIVAACGSKIVSTKRSWGKTPNHPQGRAVDVQGNPSCIYAHLKDWPGGVSVDYAAVQHVHFSYNPRHEWGLRFRHNGGGHRYARGRHHDQETNAPPIAGAHLN